MGLFSSTKYLLKKLVANTLSTLGYVLISKEAYLQLEKNSQLIQLMEIWREIGSESEMSEKEWVGWAKQSRSQLGQDLLALHFSGVKRGGYFVEFGATDGVAGSNTFLLEKVFGWTGILAEPARKWQKSLGQNRNSEIDHRCVYSHSGQKIVFQEAGGGLSTIKSYSSSDMHAASRKESVEYEVETITLNDLLEEHGSPKHIDFLSIDTEGSELEILAALDFHKYSFGFICAEHNHTKNRETLEALLAGNGYKAIYPELSDFDGWFIPNP